MPLELTDFDRTGLEVDALAVIIAAAPVLNGIAAGGRFLVGVARR